MDSRTYTISQLSKEFGITTRTIRYYEDQGLISPGRNGRQRIYSRRDRARLKLILRGKRLGLPLRDIGEIIDMYNAEPGEAGQLRHLIDRIDQEVGRVLEQLKAMNALENTLILFLSDNGASAEIMVRTDGHDAKAAPGSGPSYLCLGPGWSTSSNSATPGPSVVSGLRSRRALASIEAREARKAERRRSPIPLICCRLPLKAAFSSASRLSICSSS